MKNIGTKELGSDHWPFRELFLYSLDTTDLHGDVQWGEKAHLYVFIYYFSHGLDCIFCRGLERRVLYTIKLENSNKELFIL